MNKLLHPVTTSLHLNDDNTVTMTFVCRSEADAEAAFEAIAEILTSGGDLGSMRLPPAVSSGTSH